MASSSEARPGPSIIDACRDRLWGWRDALLADRGFKRLAAAFPPTRPLVRRRVRALFDLCAGFVYSQALLATVRLGLLEALEHGPRSLDALADELDVPADGLIRLLDAAVALRLVERRANRRFGLGPLGAAMVRDDGIKAMVDHHALLYADLEDPVALLRGEPRSRKLQTYWGYGRTDRPDLLDGDATQAYSALMSASQAFIADDVIAAFPFKRHRRLLDVGGGNGTFVEAVAEAVPGLELALFDLPAVAERTRERLRGRGVEAAVTGGDFFHDPLPRGADLVTLVRILHDHDDERVLRVLRAIRVAMSPDGVLLVAEPMAATPGAEPIGAAYFGFYLLAMGSGRPRTPDELGALLMNAGFKAPRLLRTRTPLLVRVMAARPAVPSVSQS